MAKKKLLKAAIGVGAVAVAGKVAYDKYKVVKASFDKEEKDSAYDEVTNLQPRQEPCGKEDAVVYRL